MTTSLAVPENHYHVRSISMPSRSHPNTDRIEEELVKIRNWEKNSTSSTSPLKGKQICSGLSILGNLYNCVEDLLCLPLTQQAAIHQEQEKRMNEALDKSVRLLDTCTTSRDILLSMKEHVQNLQSTLRRRVAQVSTENEAYMCFRKKVKKDAAKCHCIETNEHQICIHISPRSRCPIYNGPRPKTRKSTWLLVSKVMRKGQVACEEVHEGADEVESVDAALYTLCHSKYNEERMQTAQKGFKTLEISIKDIDIGLECLYKQLIQTRVSMLNILAP